MENYYDRKYLDVSNILQYNDVMYINTIQYYIKWRNVHEYNTVLHTVM